VRPMHQVVNSWSPFSRFDRPTKARIFAIARTLGVSHEFLMILRFEVEMGFLRLRNTFSQRYRRRVRALRSQTGLKLNIGCGNDVIRGWVNIDAFAPSFDADETLLIDLRDPLPLADGSAKSVYSEHLLEHFDRERVAQPLLAEFHRVLEPRGIARVIVPDGGKFLAAYLDQSHPLRKLFPAEDWMHVVNRIARASGHRYMYDAPTLIKDLLNAGFAEAHEVRPGEGSLAEFVMDNEDPVRRATSLYVEATKG
jgi:predicted SAM-dependent methyltransferase